MLHKHVQNMYNPNSKISLLLLSSITTMLVEIQGENKKVKRSEVKKREGNGPTWISNCHFRAYIKKSAHSLFGAWSFLFIHIRFTPSERPKNFVNWFFRQSDQTIEVGSSSRTMEKCHLLWSHFMVHGVKRPYSLSSNSCHSYISLTLSLQFPPLFLLKVAWVKIVGLIFLWEIFSVRAC